jgi:toxin HigB-1
MIDGFRDDWLRSFFIEDVRHRRVPSTLENALFRKLQLIDDAVSDADLRTPPGNRFEKLSGNLEGLHSIRVNQQYRLVFRWDAERGAAVELYLDDHSYK